MGRNGDFCFLKVGVFLYQAVATDFFSNQEVGIYCFILWRSLVDLLRRATMKVMTMNKIVDKAEVARFTWNQY